MVSQEKEPCSNILEMKAVQVALNSFLDRAIGEVLALMNYITTVVMYLEKPGESISLAVCRLAQEIIVLLELHMVSISTRHIVGNSLAVLPTELPPLSQMIDDICWKLGHPLVDLYASGKCKAPSPCISHSRYHGLDGRCLPTPTGQHKCVWFPSVGSHPADSVESHDLEEPIPPLNIQPVAIVRGAWEAASCCLS